MSRDATCDACGRAAPVGDGLRVLAELGFGPGHEDHAIHLCEGCLERKDTRSWAVEDPLGQRLHETLQRQNQTPTRRYSYLIEPGERIHLVRLRPEWVERHAAEA